MRTVMHQDAFPGEDISDRPEPGTVVPALLALLDRRPESGRHRASAFAVPADAGAADSPIADSPAVPVPTSVEELS